MKHTVSSVCWQLHPSPCLGKKGSESRKLKPDCGVRICLLNINFYTWWASSNCRKIFFTSREAGPVWCYWRLGEGMKPEGALSQGHPLRSSLSFSGVWHGEVKGDVAHRRRFPPFQSILPPKPTFLQHSSAPSIRAVCCRLNKDQVLQKILFDFSTVNISV